MIQLVVAPHVRGGQAQFLKGVDIALDETSYYRDQTHKP